MPKWKAESELSGDKSCQNKTLTELSGKINVQKSFCALYDQCRAPSMLSAAPASWDFSVAHGGMYNIKRQVNSNCHMNKGKVIGSTLNISQVMGCEMLSSQHLDIIRAEGLFTIFCCY